MAAHTIEVRSLSPQLPVVCGIFFSISETFSFLPFAGNTNTVFACACVLMRSVNVEFHFAMI